MNKNEDRIWDILIEDALRDSTAAGQPQPPGDHTRRLLTPVGPPGVDRGRSMRRTQRKRWTSVTATVVAFALVAGLFYAAATWLPELAKTNDAITTDHPQAAADNDPSPARQDGGNATQVPPQHESEVPPTTNTEPESSHKPDTRPESETNAKPEPENQPEPKPDDEVKQPKPEPESQPEPKKPDDTVEQPKPDDTTEKPKPDDTVEQPKQPEETTPGPDTRLHINLLTKVDWEKPGKKALQYSPDGEIWSQAYKLTEFAGNVWLRSRTGMDFEAGGVFLRLNGTMRVSLAETGLEVELSDDELYIDSRGANTDVSLSDGRHSATLVSSSAYFEMKAGMTRVSLYEGELKLGDDVIAGPKQGVLGDRGEGKLFEPLRRERRAEHLLVDLEERVVYHEGFDTVEPKGRLREGTIKDGVLSGTKVFWGFPDEIHYEAGLVIRLRVRFTGADSVTLTQFSPLRNDNFSYEIDADHRLKVGEWYTLEVPLSEFRARTNHRDPPDEQDWFQNVSLGPNGENAQVELDWVEFIRAVK